MPIQSAVPPDLASVRRGRGVSLEQIAHSTKIGVNYLQAIEAGDFEKLPGGVYSTSYIRQYAQAVDMDETELLEYYYEKTGTRPLSAVDPEPVPQRKSLAQLLHLPPVRLLS